MSEESIQVFRGNEAPEITYTESRTTDRPRPPAAPLADPRALSDAKDGPADSKSLPVGTETADASQRRIDDAVGDRDPEVRQWEDSTATLPAGGEQAPAPEHAHAGPPAAAEAQGPAAIREWQDTTAAAPAGAAMNDSTTVLPADGAHGDGTVMLARAEALKDSTVMLPETGAIEDSTAMLPAADTASDSPVGPTEIRQLADTSVSLPASGAPPQAGIALPSEASNSRSGPSDTRSLRDTIAAKPGANFQPDAEPPVPAAAREAQRSEPTDARPLQDLRAAVPPAATDPTPPAAAAAAAAAAGGISDPDLTFKAEHDATPWALSIHLQERIASLGVSTARVGNQLDALEESIKRLGKRIKR